MAKIEFKPGEYGPQIFKKINKVGKKFSKNNDASIKIVEESTNTFPVNEVGVINSTTGKKVRKEEVKKIGGNVDIIV